MRLPVWNPDDRSTVNLEVVKQMVDCFMERGFSYFDTAHRYNDEASEPALRQALVDRYDRRQYFLTNKITLNYITNEDVQEQFFKDQLKICGVDFFDRYLIHNVGRLSFPTFEKLKTFTFVKRMQEEGYTKEIGFSFHGTADVLEQILQAHPEMEYVQLQINYLDWDDPVIQSRKCYEVARKYNKKIIVMEPVKGGMLTNLPSEAAQLLMQSNLQASHASWAIRFAASLDGVETVLSGMSTLEQIEDNTGYMQHFKPLTDEEQLLLSKVAAIISANTAITCTSCRYCTTECPKQIAIPDYFGLYNNLKRLESNSYMANQKVYYSNLTANHGKASDCIACGICEKNCPQHLPIRSLLRIVATALE